MKILIIINDAPYGTEKAYNAFRFALALQKESRISEVRIFLMADAVTCALKNQNTPSGYYNIERMLKGVVSAKGKIKLCGSCCDARGIKNLSLADGTEISTMAELAAWTADSDTVVTF